MIAAKSRFYLLHTVCADSALGVLTTTITCFEFLAHIFCLSFAAQSIIFNDSSGQQIVGCDMNLGLFANSYETSLGWSISAATYTDLKLTCSCSQAGTFSCFSKDTTVEMEGRGHVSITELNVGDRVRTTSGSFKQVYSFGHRDEGKETNFVTLYTDHSDKPLELTPEHMLFVDETDYLFGVWPQSRAVRSDAVEAGDVLLIDGEKYPVTRVDYVVKQGAYMPLTTDGTILVNHGIHASSYVSIQDQAESVVESFGFYWFSEQNLNQWWLSPYRMLCMGVSSSFCSTNPNMMRAEGEVDAGILRWLLFGRTYAESANEFTFFWHHVVGIPTAIVFGLCMLTEAIFGATLAPTAILVGFLSGCVIYLRRRDQAKA